MGLLLGSLIKDSLWKSLHYPLHLLQISIMCASGAFFPSSFIAFFSVVRLRVVQYPNKADVYHSSLAYLVGRGDSTCLLVVAQNRWWCCGTEFRWHYYKQAKHNGKR